MLALAWRAVLLWMIPVLISIPLFERTGKLLVDERTFSTLMAVSFSAVSVWALRGALLLPIQLRPAYFRNDNNVVTRYALMCGGIYFLACCVLDLTLLVPFINTNEYYTPLTTTSWFFQMGLGYTTVILQAYLAGIVADKELERRAEAAVVDENTNLTTATAATEE